MRPCRCVSSPVTTQPCFLFALGAISCVTRIGAPVAVPSWFKNSFSISKPAREPIAWALVLVSHTLDFFSIFLAMSSQRSLIVGAGCSSLPGTEHASLPSIVTVVS
jgi:hypothetical protein